MTESTEQMIADLWFKRLADLLKKQKLPCEHGPARFAEADEFMFMYMETNVGYFKHRDTRNYIEVRYVAPNYTLVIPINDSTDEPVNTGFYDKIEFPPIKNTPHFYRGWHIYRDPFVHSPDPAYTAELHGEKIYGFSRHDTENKIDARLNTEQTDEGETFLELTPIPKNIQDQVQAMFDQAKLKELLQTLQDAAYDVGFSEGRQLPKHNKEHKQRLKAAEQALEQLLNVKPEWTM
jgi:hypothetical protein